MLTIGSLFTCRAFDRYMRYNPMYDPNKPRTLTHKTTFMVSARLQPPGNACDFYFVRYMVLTMTAKDMKSSDVE